MKVVIVDNYDRGKYPEKLVADGLTLEQAEALAAEKNDAEHPHSENFYRVVEDDYELFRGFEP